MPSFCPWMSTRSVPVISERRFVTESITAAMVQVRPSVTFSGETADIALLSGSSVRIVATSWCFAGSNASSSLMKAPRIAKPVVSWPRLMR